MKVHSNVDLNDPLVFKLWAKAVSDALNPEDWKTPTFTNSWANATGRTTKYYKQLDRVYIEGRVDTGTNGTSAFTLPEGYRPDEDLRFISLEGTATLAYVDISTTGTVTISTGSVSGCTLDGISFRV